MVPGTTCTVPGAQSAGSTHVVWFGPVVLVPAAHAPHTRSLVSEPGVSTNWLVKQSVQTAQLVALSTSLNVPLVQPAQLLSSVALPSVLTD